MKVCDTYPSCSMRVVVNEEQSAVWCDGHGPTRRQRFFTVIAASGAVKRLCPLQKSRTISFLQTTIFHCAWSNQPRHKKASALRPRVTHAVSEIGPTEQFLCTRGPDPKVI